MARHEGRQTFYRANPACVVEVVARFSAVQNSVMYLDSITLTLTLPCLAEPGKLIVIGTPNRSFDEVLPIWRRCPASSPTIRCTHFDISPPSGFMTLYADSRVHYAGQNADEGLELLLR